MQTSPTIDALAAALAAANTEIVNPPRNREVKVTMKSGGTYTFKYATLDGILDGVRPILASHGLSIVQTTGESENGCVVGTTLLHASGQWMQFETPAFFDPAGGAQAYGSAVSYARRYAVTSLLCLAADEDDDGNAATGNHAEGRDRKPAKPAPRNGVDWVAMANDCQDVPTLRTILQSAKDAGADQATLAAIVAIGRSRAPQPAQAPQTPAPQPAPVPEESAPPATAGEPEVASLRNEAMKLAETKNVSDVWSTAKKLQAASLSELQAALPMLRRRCSKKQAELLDSLCRETGTDVEALRETYSVRSRSHLLADDCSRLIDRLTAERNERLPPMDPRQDRGFDEP